MLSKIPLGKILAGLIFLGLPPGALTILTNHGFWYLLSMWTGTLIFVFLFFAAAIVLFE